MPALFYPGQLYPGRAYAPLDEQITAAGGIASAETWGSPTLGVSIDAAGGIASAEAWGAPSTDTVSPITSAGGIASAEAWGAPALDSAITLTDAGGIPSSEAWGAPSMSGGTPSASSQLVGAQYPGGFYPGGGEASVIVTIQPGGIPSAEAWGAPTASTLQPLTGAGGIASAEAWGAPSIFAAIAALPRNLPYPGGFYPAGALWGALSGELRPGGIPSAEAWGSPTIPTGTSTIAPGGIPSAEAWGSPSLAGAIILLAGTQYPGGFYPGGHAFGTLSFGILDAGGIPSAEAWGVPLFTYSLPITAAGGIPSAEAWGVPSVVQGIVLAYDPSGRRRPRGISCADYDVEILSRGGASRLLILPATGITWARELDQVSQATVTCDGLSAACRRDLRGIDPWSHEVAVYRSGGRVWSGPLYFADLAINTVLTARDIMSWLEVWRIWNDHTYAANPDGTGTTDLAVIWNALLADAAQFDPIPGVAATATPCGVLGSYTALAAEHRQASGEIDALSRVGIDWTVLDRQIIAGGSAIPVEPFAYLTDEDFLTPPTIRKDGSVAANQWGVRGAGAGAGADPVWAEYGPSDASYAALRAAYGLLARDVTDDHVNDSTAALAAATTRFAANSRPPYVITDAVLSPSAALKIDDLVPGRIVDLRLSETIEPIHTRYRMSRMSVDVGASGEQITLSFEPVGTP